MNSQPLLERLQRSMIPSRFADKAISSRRGVSLLHRPLHLPRFAPSRCARRSHPTIHHHLLRGWRASGQFGLRQ